MNRLATMWAALLLLCTSGCVTPKTQVATDLLEAKMPFLQVGTTQRSDVLFRLGTPFRSYEQGRIITYQIRKTDFDNLEVVVAPRMNWGGDEFGGSLHIYSLVLAFDSNDVIERQSLVLIR